MALPIFYFKYVNDMSNKLNITPGPWELKSDELGPSTITTKAEVNGNVICQPPIWAESLSYYDDNATAIVTAVNNTYHKGINPEAVPEILEALKIAKNYIDVFLIRGEDPLVGENIKTHSYMIIEALKKATL
jgi:hypothetical protein